MTARRSGVAHPRPAGDLRERTTAADTKTRLAVEQADIDARRFQGGSRPAAGPGANVGIGVAPGNCRRGKNRHAGSLPRRVRVRGVRGDGAPKSAKSLWLVPCGTRAPSGAPITAVAATGPAFVRSVAHRIAPTDPSASSWQGLLVAPEGAPMPPECLVATRPAGAAPRPASRRLMNTPLAGRGGCIISEVWEAGIMRGQLPHIHSPLWRGRPAAREAGDWRRASGDWFLRSSPLTPHRAPDGARARPGMTGSLLQRSGERADVLPAKAGIQGQPRRARALDTGFRRYDGAAGRVLNLSG